MYYPSRRHPDLFNPLFNPVLKDFDKQSECHLFKKEKDFVALTFENVPYGKNFRWDKTWWKKVGVKWGMNEQEHEFEIPPNNLVGMHFKDLSKKERENIVDLKDE